jgi:hypothetical protein
VDRTNRRNLEYLTEGLESQDPVVREASVCNIFPFFDMAIVPVLVALLQAPETSVVGAVELLLKAGLRRTRNQILALIRSPG